MNKYLKRACLLFACAVSLMLLLVGCGIATPAPTETISEEPTAIPEPSATVAAIPVILNVIPDRVELGRYESLELTISAQTQAVNPYDMREIRLDGIFTDPDGGQMAIPGFWDGKDLWRMRFTPAKVGDWTYELIIKDTNGLSKSVRGTFIVTPSALHGWLQPAKSVNAAYSSHYLAYHDGTPFYGVGHGEATIISASSFDQMQKAGENYVVWWPFYANSPVDGSYKDYNVRNMDALDLLVKAAEKKGISLIFTVWDHPTLGKEKWASNGFSQLTDIQSFFTDEDSWAWQENFYRYIMARWGYSPAIGMWQTVSEIDATNASNPWHQKVNDYFTANDPYRHPTTASSADDAAWPEGNALMDVPQAHLYDFKSETASIDAVYAAQVIAEWTKARWAQTEKPNWVGTFGVPDNSYYPEMLHSAIWAGLASGAALTPAEWNDGAAWDKMTPEMDADLLRFSQFVAGIPLAKLNPSPLSITSSNEQVRGWGIASADGGLFWIQDSALEGKPIKALRKDQSVRVGELNITGMPSGIYIITAYDPWQGLYKKPVEAICTEGVVCQIKMPKFHSDLAFKIEKK